MTDVFISYARSDRKRVRLIALGLSAEGFSVWWDPEIKPGAKWNDAIRKSLDNAAAVITCWSPDSVKSRWVVAETTHASNKNNLVPCTVRACQPPIPFNMIQSADLSHWKGDADDADWVLLLRQVRRLVEAKRRAAVAAPPPGEAEARTRPPVHDDAPGRYRVSQTRGRLGPRLGQFVLGTVVVGAALTAGLWAMDRQFYTPGAPTPPPVQDAVIEANTVAPSSAPAPTPAPDDPPREALPDAVTEISESPPPTTPPPPPPPQSGNTAAVDEAGKPVATPASAAPASTPPPPQQQTSNPVGDFITNLLEEWARQRNAQQQSGGTVITGDTQSALSRDVDQCLTDMARACTYYPPDGYPRDFAVNGTMSNSEQRLLSTRGFPEPGLPTQANLNYCRAAIQRGQGDASQRVQTPLVSACSQVHTVVIR